MAAELPLFLVGFGKWVQGSLPELRIRGERPLQSQPNGRNLT